MTNQGGIFASTTTRGFDDAVAKLVTWRGSTVDERTAGPWRLCVTGGATIGSWGDVVVAMHGTPDIGSALLDADEVARRFVTDRRSWLSQLHGSFALVVVDTRANVVHAIRDFMGTKPLVWGEGAAGTAIASEPLAIPLLLGARPEPDDQAMALYLKGGRPDTTLTMVKGASAFGPNSVTTLSEAHMVSELLPVEITPLALSDDEALATTREVLDVAVRWSAQSATRVIAAASAGVDSSVVACSALSQGIAQAVITHQTEGLDQWNEVPRASLIADRFDVPHHVEKIHPPDALHRVSEEILMHGAPNPTSWLSFATIEASAALGFDALLVGHLSDEWLTMAGGSLTHAMVDRDVKHIGSYVRAEVDSDDMYWTDVPSYLARLAASSVLRPGRYADRVLARFHGDGGVQRTLNSLERVACARNISIGLPFADRNYVTHVLGLPVWQRNRPGEPKWVLRQAYADLLPGPHVSAPVKANFFDLPSLALNGEKTGIAAVRHLIVTWAEEWRQALEAAA